jgi:transposase-like protein
LRNATGGDLLNTEEPFMTDTAASSSSLQDLRVQAVLALLQGNPAAQVSARYGIGRSTLYKFRRRAKNNLTL